MADKNIQMTQRNSANTGWDNLNPITIANNVTFSNGKTVEAFVGKKDGTIQQDLKAEYIGNLRYTDVQDKTKLAGIVVAFAGISYKTPYGFLECDGSAVSRSTYKNLFDVIDTNFGVGDGSTTFNVPDLRGQFIRGFDNGKGVDIGRTFGSKQSDGFKSHTHRIRGTVGSGYAASGAITQTGRDYDSSAGILVEDSGGAETRPKNIALNYCIHY